MSHKSLFRLLPVLLSMALLAGCVGTGGSGEMSGCVYKERDLTQPWGDRTYWCQPAQPAASSAELRRAG